MPFPPNLFLIGAQKAGTTFLANLIGQHPDVCVSEPKEPAYLTRNYDKGLDWYKSNFCHPNAAYLVDATPGYTSSPLPATDVELSSSGFWGVPERLKSLAPDSQLLYIVRDPVARTYSAYWHNVRAGHESREFREALSEDSYYLRTSRYFDQLALYREHFRREQILVLAFEDLVKNPLDMATRCFSFLALDPLDSIKTERGKNRSFAYPAGLSQLNRALSSIGGLNRITKAIQPYTPIWVKNWLYGTVAQKIPKIRQDDREFLVDYFRDRNREFSDEYDFDIERWR